MDILNWLYIKKQQLIRTTPDSTSDLVVLGADATFANRGDEYKSYAMPLKDVVTQYDNAGTAGTFDTPIDAGATVTLNGYTGRINFGTSGLTTQGVYSFTLLNDKIQAIGSRIFLSCGYSGAGFPVPLYANVSDGEMVIKIFNADPQDSMNTVTIVTFEILPA